MQKKNHPPVITLGSINYQQALVIDPEEKHTFFNNVKIDNRDRSVQVKCDKPGVYRILLATSGFWEKMPTEEGGKFFSDRLSEIKKAIECSREIDEDLVGSIEMLSKPPYTYEQKLGLLTTDCTVETLTARACCAEAVAWGMESVAVAIITVKVPATKQGLTNQGLSGNRKVHTPTNPDTKTSKFESVKKATSTFLSRYYKPFCAGLLFGGFILFVIIREESIQFAKLRNMNSY